MDAHALLTSQGWRGSGHSLHKSDDNIGLAKPILASRKNNTLGIGRKNHVTSDQWWLNALDEQLKSLDTSSKTSIVQTKTHTKLDSLLTSGAGKYTGANALYACFVSGGLLQGTIEKNDADSEVSTDATPEAETTPVERKESKEQRRARREEKRRKKAAKLIREAEAAAKAARAIEKLSKSKDKKTGAKLKDSIKRKDKSKKGKKDKKSAQTESKEERRARKDAKRKRRAEKEKQHKVEEG